jgi:hypothetical protein
VLRAPEGARDQIRAVGVGVVRLAVTKDGLETV